MKKVTPFQQAQPLHKQITARRLNQLNNSIPRISFAGGGARVSKLGDQVFVQFPRVVGGGAAAAIVWTWKLYSGIIGSGSDFTPVIWCNSANGSTSDGGMPTLNGQVGCINRTPCAPITGTPPVAPALTISASGYIYCHITLNADGTINTMGGMGNTGLDIIFYDTAQVGIDTNTPPTFANILLGQVTYDGGNNTITGLSQAQMPYGMSVWLLCGNIPQWW